METSVQFWTLVVTAICLSAYFHECSRLMRGPARRRTYVNLTSTHKNYGTLDDKLKLFFIIAFQDFTRSEYLKWKVSVKLILKESHAFEGSKYILSSAVSNQNRGVSNLFCNLQGGYLVEIGSRRELEFVKSFIKQHANYHKLLLTGGTKSPLKCSWHYFESESPVYYFYWAHEQPDSQAEDVCIYLSRKHGWAFEDDLCDVNAYSENERGFICEIPVQ